MKCTHWLAGWSPAPAYYGEVSFGHKFSVSQASCIMMLYLSWTRNQQSRGLCINTSEAVTPSKPSLKSFSEAVWSQLLRSDVKPLLWVLTARCLGSSYVEPLGSALSASFSGLFSPRHVVFFVTTPFCLSSAG